MMGDRPYVLRITSNGFEILIGGGATGWIGNIYEKMGGVAEDRRFEGILVEGLFF